MSGATPDVGERLAFAATAAREAGARILRHYGELDHETKPGGSPVTRADLEANAFLVEAIHRSFPGEPVLAEESSDSTERLTATRLWIVDPLDGTKEFLAGNGEFSVMIGYIEAGSPVMAVVYLPARSVLYTAGSGQGAWVEAGSEKRRLRCQPADPASLRMVGSRSHPDALLERMRLRLGVTDVEPSGSVGIKCALIAEGSRDLYIHPVPYLKEWDTCAPQLLLTEAGGTVTDCRGQPLGYNKRSPAQPHGILACSSEIHGQVLDVIGPLYEQASAERQAAVSSNGAGTRGSERIG